MFIRIALLMSIVWVMSLTRPLMTLFGVELSGRSLILAGGGLFLIFKSTREIHDNLEGEATPSTRRAQRGVVCRRHHPDSAARHRLFARLGDHRRRHGGVRRRS